MEVNGVNITSIYVDIFLLGKMKGIAFITDPDGYWIEILNGQAVNQLTNQ